MARLPRLAHRVVWVNPHRGQPGYAPLTAGMAAALPHVDDFVAGHSLAALERAGRVLLGGRGAAMRDVLDEVAALVRRRASGSAWPPWSSTWRSAPRQPGAAMAVAPDGEAVGSVSGGCVEGAVYELAQEVLATGEPVLQRYGVSDDDAFAVGLTCGGIIDMFVEPVDRDDVPGARRGGRVDRGREPVAVATVVGGPGRDRRPPRRLAGPAAGSLGSRAARRRGRPTTRAACSTHGTTGVLRYGADGERRPGRAGACSCSRSRRRRGCWSSARSTSRPPWPGSARSSATA